jgi:mannose-6-phosphate isomerase-like protein (cupin superfamily)
MPTTHSHRVRFYRPDVNCYSQQWHLHNCNRLLRAIKGIGWLLQFKEETCQLDQGEMVFVPAGQLHRLVPGHSTLVLEIIEDYTTTENYYETESINKSVK